MHICAKHEVGEVLFESIWKELLNRKCYGYINELLLANDIEGHSPLQVAARFNHEPACERFLEYIKQNLNSNGAYLLQIRGAVHEASRAGYLTILKQIVLSYSETQSQQSPSDKVHRILQMHDDNGYTCLHIAAAQGNI